MAKKKKQSKHMRKLVVICALSSIVFLTATFAWFIGMRTVTVETFEVSIATTDSLLLSLDGKKWDTEVTINSSNYMAPSVNAEGKSYENNTNFWGSLKPVSTIGMFDGDSSTLRLYEKGSLATTEGGYRLMASEVPNHTKGTNGTGIEKEGYVAFDLFVKNFSGREYYTTNDVKNEEEIYLTTDSSVGVGISGVEGTGIENSVRVAFAQVGRISAKTTDPAKITSITCEYDSERSTEDGGPGPIYNATTGVTGICRQASIWEPNEKAHTAEALSYYNTSCMKRTGASVFATGAYSTTDGCDSYDQTDDIPTFVVNSVINDTNNSLVDVYDGHNSYGYTLEEGETEIAENAIVNTYLTNLKTFTDTDKLVAGAAREEIFTLAPNSITKLRIYIYIEGQDIDNYDLASIGKQITVGFGFTKDRFDYSTNTDLNPNYPDNVVGHDTFKPTISVTGATGNAITKAAADVTDFDWLSIVKATDKKVVATGETPNITYVESDAEADLIDITSRVEIVNNTVKTTAGEYLVSYMVSDWAGNYTQYDLTVTVTE